MRQAILTFVTFLAAASVCHAQDPNAAEARLRDALRQMTVRVQTAEAESVTLKAAQTELETKNKALAAQIEKLTKQSAEEKATAEKAALAAESKLLERETEIARTKEALEKWKIGHAQVTELAKKTESARASLAAKATALDLKTADLTRKNLALYKLGNEILTRLERFSYGEALAAREPFIGTSRVKLENQVQGYKDQLLDPKLKP